MKETLPKVIKKKKDIRDVVAHGEKNKGRYLVVYVKAPSGDEGRFCILVGGKVKKAVDRNRIKRLLREIVRKNKHLLKKHGDAVLCYSLNRAEISHDELEADFKDLFV